MVGIHHGNKRDPFGHDDVARLQRLTPHLARALQIRRLFLQSELRGQALEAIVNRNKTGMVGRSGDGAALFVNDAARAIAGARDGIGLKSHGRLVAADRAAAKRLAVLDAIVANGGAGGLVRFRRPSGRPPYVVLVSPLPSAEGRVRGGILFTIHDPTRRVTSAAQRIAQLLHVPIGAAKLVAALLDGTELKDYSDQEKSR